MSLPHTLQSFILTQPVPFFCMIFQIMAVILLWAEKQLDSTCKSKF